ncbi:hypothetical protein NC651_008772 [Populus alba x Populus x berolinensis]|nr:hypothetical protein NC651_008772 [Populus alba x Populus x berolinensis]
MRVRVWQASRQAGVGLGNGGSSSAFVCLIHELTQKKHESGSHISGDRAVFVSGTHARLYSSLTLWIMRSNNTSSNHTLYPFLAYCLLSPGNLVINDFKMLNFAFEFCVNFK